MIGPDSRDRPRAEFFRGNADERIAQLTYERHCLRVQDNVKEISVLRKEISIDPRNAYGEVRKNRELDAGEHGRMQTKMEKIVPGHFPNPIRALLSPEDQSVDPKTVLGPEERAEMKNFISRAWKELRLVMDDQRREERKKERSPGNSSSKGSRRPSPRNEAAGSSVGKNNRESENEKEGSRAGSGMCQEDDGRVRQGEEFGEKGRLAHVKDGRIRPDEPDHRTTKGAETD